LPIFVSSTTTIDYYYHTTLFSLTYSYFFFSLKKRSRYTSVPTFIHMKKESGNYLINTKHGIQFLGNEFHRLNAIYNIIGREQYSRTISSSSSFFYVFVCIFSFFKSSRLPQSCLYSAAAVSSVNNRLIVPIPSNDLHFFSLSQTKLYYFLLLLLPPPLSPPSSSSFSSPPLRLILDASAYRKERGNARRKRKRKIDEGGGHDWSCCWGLRKRILTVYTHTYFL